MGLGWTIAGWVSRTREWVLWRGGQGGGGAGRKRIAIDQGELVRRVVLIFASCAEVQLYSTDAYVGSSAGMMSEDCNECDVLRRGDVGAWMVSMVLYRFSYDGLWVDGCWTRVGRCWI